MLTIGRSAWIAMRPRLSVTLGGISTTLHPTDAQTFEHHILFGEGFHVTNRQSHKVGEVNKRCRVPPEDRPEAAKMGLSKPPQTSLRTR